MLRTSRRRSTPPGTRAGHDISVEVKLDAGVADRERWSAPRKIRWRARAAALGRAAACSDQATIPNKDFMLQ